MFQSQNTWCAFIIIYTYILAWIFKRATYVACLWFLSFQPKKNRLTCFVWELPASHQKNPVHCQPVRFRHHKSQDPQWKTFAEGVALPYQKNKTHCYPLARAFLHCATQIPNCRKYSIHEHFSWFAPFCGYLCQFVGILRPFCSQNCPVFYFIIFIYWCRMWTPRLHSTSGWQLVQQKNAQFQSPSELSSVDAKKMSRIELPVIVGTNSGNEQKSINLAKQAIWSVSSEICLFDKKVYQISKRAKNSARLKIQE